MAKRGRVSNADIGVILKNSKLPIAKIAAMVDRTEKQVQAVLDKYVDESTERYSDATTTEVFRKRGPAGKAMGRKTIGGRDGVAIMTAAASQHGDEFRKKITKPVREDAIFRPMDGVEDD